MEIKNILYFLIFYILKEKKFEIGWTFFLC